MTVLLDVNVLVAMMWPTHAAHRRVHRWFELAARAEWATCPFTQAGLIRIISNPSFSPLAVTPREAARLLSNNLEHPFHRFWKDEITFAEAVRPFETRLRGHQQVSDAYLLGLALHKRGKLATLDASIASLFLHDSQKKYLELIAP